MQKRPGANRNTYRKNLDDRNIDDIAELCSKSFKQKSVRDICQNKYDAWGSVSATPSATLCLGEQLTMREVRLKCCDLQIRIQLLHALPKDLKELEMDISSGPLQFGKKGFP
eukprot:4343429-Amphidinium_carterae.1